MTRHRYCIIETGLASESLTPAWGDFPAMARTLLEPCLPGACFDTVSVVTGEALPSPTDRDGYIVMGSEHSVRDRFDWILRLEAFIREIARAQVPMVGICFGHQVMASALGGRVEEAGWIVGMAEYAIAGSNAVTCSIAFHQDQVTLVPPGVDQVLSAGDCPNAGFRYRDFPGWSVQSHPEFSVAYMQALVEHCRGEPLSDEVTDAALASLDRPLDQEFIVRAMVGTLAG